MIDWRDNLEQMARWVRGMTPEQIDALWSRNDGKLGSVTVVRELEQAEYAENLPLQERIRQRIEIMERGAEEIATDAIKGELELAFPGKKFKLAVRCAIAYTLVWKD